jgi:phosphatidylglycerophosphate synthase
MTSQSLLSGTTGDLVFILGFTAFFALPFFVYIMLVATGGVSLPPAKHKGAGKRLFGPLFIGFYYWLLGPAFRFVNRTSLTPNHITFASLMVSVVSAIAIATGHFALAAVLVIGGSSLDMFDGQLARAKKLATPAGAFFDSTADRISDGFIFGGCVVYYAGTPIMYVALVTCIMAFTVSYARARGEALGVNGAEGLMQRADRIVILGISLGFAPFFAHRTEGFVAHPFYALTAGALCLLAVLNAVTAVSRILWTMKQLRGVPVQNALRARDDTALPVTAVAAASSAGALLGQHGRPAA